MAEKSPNVFMLPNKYSITSALVRFYLYIYVYSFVIGATVGTIEPQIAPETLNRADLGPPVFRHFDALTCGEGGARPDHPDHTL